MDFALIKGIKEGKKVTKEGEDKAKAGMAGSYNKSKILREGEEKPKTKREKALFG